MAKQTKRPEAAGPVTTYDWSQSDASGFEATRQEDLGIPFLSILQSGSPQIKKTDPNYATKRIDDAGEGDIINTLANVVVYRHGKEPVEFIPCYHERMFVEWKPRNAGGGLVKMHHNPIILNECSRDEKGQDTLKSGNIIRTTSYFYGLMLRGGESLPCIVGMASTGLKVARAWLNQMMSIKLSGPHGQFTPPMFSHIYNITTVPESNSDGSWMNWHVSVRGQLADMNLITRANKMAKDSAAASRAALPPPTSENDAVLA